MAIRRTGYALHSGSEEEWAGARPDSRPQTGVKQLQTVHATVDTQALTLSAPQSACPWEQRRPSGSRPSRRMRQDLYLTRSDPGTSRAVCAQTRPQPESSAYPVPQIQQISWRGPGGCNQTRCKPQMNADGHRLSPEPNTLCALWFNIGFRARARDLTGAPS